MKTGWFTRRSLRGLRNNLGMVTEHSTVRLQRLSSPPSQLSYLTLLRSSNHASPNPDKL